MFAGDVLKTRRRRRALPHLLAPPATPGAAFRPPLQESTWIEPAPDARFDVPDAAEPGPDRRVSLRESIGLAFVIALQFLSPKQRAALLLVDVLGWTPQEAASLLDTSMVSIHSLLQRARKSDQRSNADVVRWQFWDSSHFSPPLDSLAFQLIIKPLLGLGRPDAGKVEEALTEFRRFAAVLDQRLDGRQYVVGGALALADLTLAASLMYAQQSDLPLGHFPNLQAWFSRISDLDAWRKTQP